MPMDMIGHLLSSDYRFHQLFVDPADVGHAGMARARTYVFCAHKQTCSYIMDVHEMHHFIAEGIRDFVQTRPCDYMVTPEHVRTLFQQQICRTRKLDFTPGHSDDYWLLNERERFLVHQLDLDYVHMYHKNPAEVEDLIYFLGDRYEHTRNRQRSRHAASDAATEAHVAHNQSASQGKRQGCPGAARHQASIAISTAPGPMTPAPGTPAAAMALAAPPPAITWPGGFVSGTDPVSTRGLAKAKGAGTSHDKDELIRNLRDEWNRLGRPMSTHVVGPDEAIRLVIQYFNVMSQGGGPHGPPPPSPAAAPPAIGWEPPAPATAAEAGTVPAIATVYTVSAEGGQWSLTSINTVTGEEVASCALPATATGYFVVVFFDGVAYFWDGSSESDMVHCGEYMAEHSAELATSAPGVAIASAMLPGMSGGEGSGGPAGPTSNALVPRLPADDDEDDFSSAEETDQPVLVAYSDGSQSLYYRQRAVELPTGTIWKLVQDPNTAEWLVDAENQDPNVKPKWVAKLLSSKRRLAKKGAADRAAGADAAGPPQPPQPAGADGPAGIEEAENLSAKKMFDLLRTKYKNTAEFASVLLQDRTLQHDMRIIVDVTGPLHEEYQRYLEVHQSGHADLLQTSAKRSLGSWYGTVMKTVQMLQSTKLIARLELTPGPVARRVLAMTDETVSEDVRAINRLFDLVVELAANRMWSQAHHGLLFPYVFAAAAVDDAREASRAKRLLRDLANAWLKLEDVVLAAPAGPCAELLQDLGTSTWQVTREILIQGRGCDWDLDNVELQNLCRALFGGPISTKDILESTFAYLRDTMRQCKNSTLAQFTQYCYVAASPYGRHRGGIPHFRPSKSDFATLHRAGFDDSEILNLNIWAPAKTPLSDDIPTRQRIGKIRPAGFHANRVAAAASAYALISAPADFERVDAAWAGCLLTRKSFFLHKPTGVFYLSFGFMKWAAQALRLDKVIRGSEEYLTLAEGEMERSAPRWLINHSVDADGPYLHVPVEIVPPACRPLLAPKGPLAFRIAGQPGDALKAALLKGAFLDKLQIKAICAAREVPVDANANKGPMLRALLKACFPGESDDFIDKLLKKQAANPGSAPAPDHEADQEELEMLIHMTAALDTSEAQHFEDMRRHAMEQLEASEERKRVRQRIARDREEGPPAEARGPAPREAGVPAGPQRNPAARKTKAPQEFLDLLPDVQALYFHWEPQNRKVWVDIRRCLAALCFRIFPCRTICACSSFCCSGGLPDLSQKTRTCSWPSGSARQAKVVAAAQVFKWVAASYNRHLKTDDDAQYAPSGAQLR
ncbi:unnamed protein product [Symbiodinium microadriaticum]|nr:unnamed protein product [Symbiodinium microadriaticum]